MDHDQSTTKRFIPRDDSENDSAGTERSFTESETLLLEDLSSSYDSEKFNLRQHLKNIKINIPSLLKAIEFIKSLIISLFFLPWKVYKKVVHSIVNAFLYIFTFQFLQSKSSIAIALLSTALIINSYQILELNRDKLDEIRVYKSYKPNTNFTYYDPDPVDSLTFYEVYEIIDNLGDFNYSPPYAIGDKRLVPAMYLDQIKETIQQNNNELPQDFKMEFSWSDWLDFDDRFKYGKQFAKLNKNKPIRSCQEFRQLVGFPRMSLLGIVKNEADILPNCTDLTWSETRSLPKSYYPRFKITSRKGEKMVPHARILHGSSYVYYTMDPPKRLIYVDGNTHTNIIVPIETKEHKLTSVFPSKIKHKMETESFLEGYPKLVEIFHDILDTIDNTKYNIEFKDTDYHDSIIYDQARINVNFKFQSEKTSFTLKRDDFINPSNMKDIERELKHFRKVGSLDNILHENIVNEMALYPNKKYGKYFEEPAIYDESNQIEGSHYDWRFYNTKEKFPEYKKVTILSRIIRAWLRFTNNQNIDTWLAHGTLLGHSFNKMMLPWDSDHDVQVSSKGMWTLAKYFNQSIIIDSTLDDEYASGYGQYFLDIGSPFFDRDDLGRVNAIDARFIDIHTGMYIDITQIADAPNKHDVVHKIDSRVDRMMIEEFELALKHHNVSKEKVLEDSNLYSCKNFHLYMIEDLTNFKRDIFMGEYAFVQENEESILDTEFQRRHEEMNYNGHTWRDKMKMWVDNDACKTDDRQGDTCLKDPYEKLMFQLTFPNGIDDIITDRRVIYPDWEGITAKFHKDFAKMYEEKDD